jgi:hypothetical protein
MPHAMEMNEAPNPIRTGFFGPEGVMTAANSGTNQIQQFGLVDLLTGYWNIRHAVALPAIPPCGQHVYPPSCRFFLRHAVVYF